MPRAVGPWTMPAKPGAGGWAEIKCRKTRYPGCGHMRWRTGICRRAGFTIMWGIEPEGPVCPALPHACPALGRWRICGKSTGIHATGTLFSRRVTSVRHWASCADAPCARTILPTCANPKNERRRCGQAVWPGGTKRIAPSGARGLDPAVLFIPAFSGFWQV